MRKDTNPASQIVEKQQIKCTPRATPPYLRHKEYLAQLNQPIENYQVNRRIGHKSHQLYSFEVFTLLYFRLPLLA